MVKLMSYKHVTDTKTVLRHECADIINTYSQHFDLKCWVKTIFSRLKSGIRKKAAPFWRGVFECTEPECNARFSFIIQDLWDETMINRRVIVQCEIKGERNHGLCFLNYIKILIIFIFKIISKK
jgi:hypothetical protein